MGEITSFTELEKLAVKWGFLPFFKNEIHGFSIEEHTPWELWFSDEKGVEGPWEWKGPAARGGNCVYGKFFDRKVGFVSLEWFPDLANYRRDGYDFDARYDDGLAQHKDKKLMNVLESHGNLLSYQLKDLCNYRKGGNKGFDTLITRLQMETYVNIADFEYRVDKYGKPYGWGVARYTTPEAQFGAGLPTAAYQTAPETSKEKIFRHLTKLLPSASEQQILKIIG